jgi:hypothetical protein
MTLTDAGFPGKEAAVFGAIRGLGHSPNQLKHLIFTPSRAALGPVRNLSSPLKIQRKNSHALSDVPPTLHNFGECS